jgi:hypothetical protein
MATDKSRTSDTLRRPRPCHDASATRLRSDAPPRYRGLRLGRVAGIEVRLDWSLILIFALIT